VVEILWVAAALPLGTVHQVGIGNRRDDDIGNRRDDAAWHRPPS